MPPVPPEDDDADAAMPEDDAEDDAAEAGDEGGEEEEPQAAAPMVLATILKNGDGSYQLISGDEPEEGEAPEEGAGPEGAAPAGGPPAPGEAPGGPQGAPAAAPGQSFDSVGALLKGVLDLVKQAEEGGPGDEGSDEANFQQGFAQEGPSQKPAVTVPATGAQ